MITVYYDGKCGICAKEIRYYKRIAPENTFVWQDLTEISQGFIEKGYKLSEGLKSLHAEDATGQMHKGVDAFILIWKQLKYWNVLAFFVALPVIKQIAKFTYKMFAKWRFANLKHCQLALANEDKLS